jgi:hypothetical protein
MGKEKFVVCKKNLKKTKEKGQFPLLPCIPKSNLHEVFQSLMLQISFFEVNYPATPKSSQKNPIRITVMHFVMSRIV